MRYILRLIGQAYFDWGYIVVCLPAFILGIIAGIKRNSRLLLYTVFSLLVLGILMTYFKYCI